METLSEYTSLDEPTRIPPKKSCKPISAALVSLAIFFSVLVVYFSVRSSTRSNITKEACCQDFVPFTFSASTEEWTGTLIDLFSPDDTNPASKRFVDFRNNELEVSASTGAEKWGRRFHPETNVNPVLEAPSKASSFSVRTVSFLSKIQRGDPLSKYAELGALNFTLTMGTSFGKRVLRFNGLYDGRGGPWVDGKVAPSDCDNFWEYQQ